ncbi:MAG TPA: SWIM zinc finger family protein [Acidimicrobiales bacterium]|nr:SWIM zinc finger family protein [Acidimicrobiales bacterium]
MKRRTFGATWWGKAWLDALEHRARLDPNRLPRGRTYARSGRVRSVHLEEGQIVGLVQGSRPNPYTVRVRIRTFTRDEWDRLLGAIAAKAGHAAALLDGELAPGIVEDARAVGIELLPGAGELQPRCSCPDWADPCKHSAAVCYLVADELDDDPFSLLELRGRARDDVLAALRGLRSGTTPATASSSRAHSRGPKSDVGILARDGWRRALAPLPPVPHPPATPGRPAPWPVDPPDGVGVTADGLAAVARDTIARAWRLARGEDSSGLALDQQSDLARRAAAALGTEDWKPLAAHSGAAPTELARQAMAWRHGGPSGLRVLQEGRWRPPTSAMIAGRDAVVASTGSVRRVSVDDNTITLDGRVQLRLGRDGRWYRFEKRSGRWELAAQPADEIEDLV